jgi:predicted peptidase
LIELNSHQKTNIKNNFQMKNLFKFHAIILIILVLSGTTNAQNDSEEMYLKKVFISQDDDSLLYRILYPLNYDKTKTYPLVLFLHGSGERGNDNELQLKHGSDLFTKAVNKEKYPAIVVFPQCPENSFWSAQIKIKKGNLNKFPVRKHPPKQVQLVIDMLNFIEASESVDTNREYIMGLSMGGIGTMEMLCYQPERFAAAVPICGAHNPKYAKRYKHIPLWYFHGAKDNVVNPQFSRDMVAKLRTLGADVRYTEYPHANHNSWDSAFAEPELLSWMFEQKKTQIIN